MENKKSNNTLIIIIIIVVCTTMFVYGTMKGHIKIKIPSFNLLDMGKNELVIEENYDLDFEDIEINTTSSDIYVKESSNDKVNVKVYGDKDKSFISTYNKKLKISSKSVDCFGLCFDKENPRVEVYLPSDYDNNMNLTSTSGDIKVDNFNKSQMKVESTSGDVTIGGAKDINVGCVSGDVSIDKVNIVSIKSISGDIKVNYVEEITSDSKSGDVRIKNMNLNKDSSIKTISGDVRINEINNIYIDAKTTSGDISIKNNNRKANLELKINTTSGDIVVK